MLLALIFLSYGGAKLAGYQFGITPEIMAQPLGQVSLAHVAWYCFGHEPFSAFVGVSQVAASLLLLWNRTALVGAVLLMAVTIFVIDLTYLRDIVAFHYALPFYLALILVGSVNSVGVRPKVFLKAKEKCDRFSKPTSNYTSEGRISRFESR